MKLVLIFSGQLGKIILVQKFFLDDTIPLNSAGRHNLEQSSIRRKFRASFRIACESFPTRPKHLYLHSASDAPSS